MNAVLRAWLLALIAVGIWFLSSYAGNPHRTVPASAPTDTFSSGRAEAALATILGPEKPHPVSSAENAAVRARILAAFAKLGMKTETYRAFTCQDWRGRDEAGCATVTDIIAQVLQGQGPAIVMMAHYDSVPAGPGASDDESGVATVLESARALKASSIVSKHPVIALITDGEEAGLLGANAFLQNADWRKKVGVVVNVEARGTNGPSLLFQTSPGDARLIDLYAANVPVAATSSLYAVIYKYLPNDTDLTLFIRDGYPSFNFAFAGNVRYYHSPFDLRRNLSEATLQMHGDNLLGVTRALTHTDYAALKGGNAVYLSVLGVFVPRIPAAWALPLAVIVFILIVIAGWLAKPDAHGKSIWGAVFAPLVLIAGCVVAGFVLAWIASLISGKGDPSYAYPVAMRIALAFAVWAVALAVSRMANVKAAALSAWLWIAGIGVVTAALLPGLSPYFVFPAVIAAVLLLISAPAAWESVAGQIALFLSALAALIVWVALIAAGETLMGLRLHELFTVPAAFALMTLLPLLAARPMRRSAWHASLILSIVVALGGAVIAGLLPAYSAASPRRVNLVYFESAGAPAHWIASTAWKADPTSPIPAALMKAGNFHFSKDIYDGLFEEGGYISPPQKQHYALPTASVRKLADADGLHRATIAFQGSTDSDATIIAVPKEAGATEIVLGGQHLAVAAGGNFVIECASRDCRSQQLTVTYKTPADVHFAEQHYGMPSFGTALAAARPATAMASQSGDGVILANSAKLP